MRPPADSKGRFERGAIYLKGGRVQRTTRWVQPSAMACRKGTASKTAPSTSRRPLQRIHN